MGFLFVFSLLLENSLRCGGVISHRGGRASLGSWLDSYPGCHLLLQKRGEQETSSSDTSGQHPLVLRETNRKRSHLLFGGIGLMNLPYHLCNIQSKRKILKAVYMSLNIWVFLSYLLERRTELGRKERGKGTLFLLFVTTIRTVLLWDKHTLHSIVLKSSILCCSPNLCILHNTWSINNNFPQHFIVKNFKHRKL